MKKEAKKPQIAIYQVIGDEQKIRVRIEDESVWLSQKLIAELFDVSIPTVNEHLKNIFESGELDENSVIRNFRITAKDGNIRDYADVTQLVVLANLEGINAELIRRGLPQSERLIQLNVIAITQMQSLVGNASIKKLK